MSVIHYIQVQNFKKETKSFLLSLSAPDYRVLEVTLTPSEWQSTLKVITEKVFSSVWLHNIFKNC